MDLRNTFNDYVRSNAVKQIQDLVTKKTVDSNELNYAFSAISQDTNIDTINELIKAGANINFKLTNKEDTWYSWFSSWIFEKNGNSPLHIAIEKNNKEVTNFLIQNGANINAVNEYGRTPLYLAVEKGDEYLINQLIANGADTNTALHLAVEKGDEGLINKLIDNGANVNAVDNFGQTPLHLAVKIGNVDLIGMLIKKGADINAKEMFGKTPLYLAVKKGDSTLVETLIDNGANVDVQDYSYGHTPLHLAVEKGNLENVENLINKGANAALVDYHAGYSSLHFSAKNYNQKIVELLLENGEKLTNTDRNGNSILHIATMYQQVDFVRLLIEKGVDVNVKNNEGKSALHLAVETGDKGLVELLIEKGANINAKDNKGQTPYELAKEKEFNTIINVFTQYGAKDEENQKHIAGYFKKIKEEMESILGSENLKISSINTDNNEQIENLFRCPISLDSAIEFKDQIMALNESSDITKLIPSMPSQSIHNKISYIICSESGWSDYDNQSQCPATRNTVINKDGIYIKTEINDFIKKYNENNLGDFFTQFDDSKESEDSCLTCFSWLETWLRVGDNFPSNDITIS